MDNSAKSFVSLIMVYTLVIGVFASLYFGIVPSGVLISTEYEVDKVSSDIISDSSEVVPYSDLSNAEQEQFRDGVSENNMASNAMLQSYSVITLDGSYFTINEDSNVSFITLFLAFILVLSAVYLGTYSDDPAKVSMFLLSVFIVTLLLFIPSVYSSGIVYVSENPVEVTEPEDVLDIEQLDTESKDMLYSTFEGGSAMPADATQEYSSLFDLDSSTYLTDTYSYVSSDGELYQIRSNIVPTYKYGQGGLIALLLCISIGHLAVQNYKMYIQSESDSS